MIADMLLGQWWSGQLGLGDIYDPAHMTTAMRTLFRENFRESFIGHDLAAVACSSSPTTRAS